MSDNNMPTNAEVVESLSRRLEQARILNNLKDCKTLEDYKELTKTYEAICNGNEEKNKK